MFSGAIPALVTPFRGGEVDEDAFCRIVEWQIASGVSALVPCGTTGESATLSYEEHYRVIRLCIDVAAGRVPVIAGVGSNDTATAVKHMRFAREAGADAGLSVAPYYNRPTQAGIIAHFDTLTSACDLPLVIYNVPGRTVTDILPETLAHLAAMPNVVAVKDASGDITRVTQHRQLIGTDFCQLSGNDDLWLAHATLGGVGCISVSANVAPGLCVDFARAMADGAHTDALALHDRLFPLHTAMFADASPGPAKYALARLHSWMTDDVRLPILRPHREAQTKIDAALAHAGLI